MKRLIFIISILFLFLLQAKANITAASGAVATADMAIQQYKATDPNYAGNKNLYEAWDIFYNTAMTVDAAAGVTQLGMAVSRINLVKTWNSFNDLIVSVKNAPAGFMEAWKAARGIDNVANDAFDINQLKNLIAKIPGIDNSSLTNLPKSFWNDAYKIVPAKGSSLESTVGKIIANGDPDGSLTEALIDDFMTGKGYSIGDAKYGANNGIDRFYYKGDINNPSEIIVFEAKQMGADGAVSLNAGNDATQLPAQMSDGWIRYVGAELRQIGKTDVGNMIKNFDNKISKYVFAVDKSTGEINILKLGSY